MATRSEPSEKSRRRDVARTLAFSTGGTLDHSLVPNVFRQELPTAFLAMTAAINRLACDKLGLASVERKEAFVHLCKRQLLDALMHRRIGCSPNIGVIRRRIACHHKEKEEPVHSSGSVSAKRSYLVRTVLQDAEESCKEPGHSVRFPGFQATFCGISDVCVQTEGPRDGRKDLSYVYRTLLLHFCLHVNLC